MKPLSDVTALVVDNGLFVEQAVCLARTYKKVYYCTPGGIQSAFPKMNDTEIGYGLENIEVVTDVFGDHFDSIDLFVFPDCYYGNLQVRLLRLGKTVWGARLGEELELSRDGCKLLMKKLGLPVGPWAKVKGMDALRQHIKTHKNQHIKVNKVRGTFETFMAKDYKSVEPKLDEIEYNLGAFKYIIELICEDDLPNKAELGTDGYTIDGKFPSVALSGCEIKDVSYAGKFGKYSDLPEPLTRFNRIMAPVFGEYGYRGFLSTEVRIGKDHVPYMIDFCSRSPSPPNELYQEFYTNFADIIWQGANGILVDPKPIAKYGAEVLIHSAWADKGCQPVDFPDELRRHVKLRNAAKINNQYYAIPQAVGLPEIGAVIGYGDTIDAAFDMCREVAKHVDGYYIKIPLESFEEAQEQIELADKFGLKMF